MFLNGCWAASQKIKLQDKSVQGGEQNPDPATCRNKKFFAVWLGTQGLARSLAKE